MQLGRRMVHIYIGRKKTRGSLRSGPSRDYSVMDLSPIRTSHPKRNVGTIRLPWYLRSLIGKKVILCGVPVGPLYVKQIPHENFLINGRWEGPTHYYNREILTCEILTVDADTIFGTLGMPAWSSL